MWYFRGEQFYNSQEFCDDVKRGDLIEVEYLRQTQKNLQLTILSCPPKGDRKQSENKKIYISKQHQFARPLNSE